MKYLILSGFILISTICLTQTTQLSVDLAATNENDIGIQASVLNDQLSRTVGVYGYSDAMDGQGVWGEGRTGVFAQGGDFGIFSSGTSRAGFFSGDLEYTGTLIGPVSDLKFKRLAKNENSYLGLVNLLHIKKFNYRYEDYPSLNLSKNVQYGLIAQDLEKIIPELVIPSARPAVYGSEGKIITEEIQYKTVNYMGLIPITIASVQELSFQVTEQQKVIDELYQRIESLTLVVELLNTKLNEIKL